MYGSFQGQPQRNTKKKLRMGSQWKTFAKETLFLVVVGLLNSFVSLRMELTLTLLYSAIYLSIMLHNGSPIQFKTNNSQSKFFIY